MRRSAIPLTLALLSATAAAQPTLDTRLQKFDEFLGNYRESRHIPSLSVAVVTEGAIAFARGYGFQDHDGEEPTTVETSYLVASVTKTFTGATLLAMEQDGLIDLDADFTALSDWDRRCAWLTESGSIFGGATLDDGTVIEAIDCEASISLRDVLTHRVNGQPGEDFLYNPVVFGRLSNFVEESTGTPYREFVYRYVLTPGGLRDTAAGWRDAEKGHVLTHLAPPFDLNDDGRARPSALPNPELNASSGIIASASELARYAIALMEGRILTPTLLETLWTPPRKASGEAEPYAIGWYVEPWRGRKLVFHTGWWPGAYTALLLLIPQERAALIALANTDGLRWQRPLDEAAIEGSPVASYYLQHVAMP